MMRRMGSDGLPNLTDVPRSEAAGRETDPETGGDQPPVVMPAAHARAAPQPELQPPPVDFRRWGGPPPSPPSRVWHRDPPPRSRQKALLLIAVGLVVLFGGLTIAAATVTTQRLDSSVGRVPDAFPSGARPAPAGIGTTFLMVGRDPATQRNPDSLADSIMLFHVTEARKHVQVVYLPVYTQVSPG